MSDNSLKKPLYSTLSQATQTKISDATQLEGKALPCHVVSVDGAIITVAFDVQSIFTLPKVSMPLFGPEYIRYPIQPGVKGMAVPADARLGYTSGRGGGIPDLSQPSNLGALAFLPLGSTEWESVDPNAVTVYGPNGVVLRDSGSGATFVLTPTSIAVMAPDSCTITSGGSQMQLTPSGWSMSGPIGNLQDGGAHTSPSIMNAAWSSMVTYLNAHTHSSSGTGPPSSPFTGGNIAPS